MSPGDNSLEAHRLKENLRVKGILVSTWADTKISAIIILPLLIIFILLKLLALAGIDEDTLHRIEKLDSWFVIASFFITGVNGLRRLVTSEFGGGEHAANG